MPLDKMTSNHVLDIHEEGITFVGSFAPFFNLMLDLFMKFVFVLGEVFEYDNTSLNRTYTADLAIENLRDVG